MKLSICFLSNSQGRVKFIIIQKKMTSKVLLLFGKLNFVPEILFKIKTVGFTVKVI